MIKTVEIQGFQSHKFSTLEFSPGINIIIGESDSGKSAINRAITWALKNRPMGDDFRNWNLKPNETTRVAIEFDNDEWIAREKGKNVNLYQTSLVEDDLKAIRSDVPQEVFDVSKMDDTNLQRQQSWFLLDDKPGAVSKKFNELANLEIMDASLQIVNSEVRSVKSNNENLKIIKEEKEKILKNLNSWLKPAKIEFHFIEKINDEINKLVEKETNISNTLNKLDEIAKIISKYNFIEKAEKDLNLLLRKKSKIKQLKDDYERVTEVKEKLGTVRSELDAYVDMNSIEKELYKLLRMFDQIEKLKKQKKIITNNVVAQKGFKKQISDLDDFISKNELVVKYILEDLGICPLCNQTIKEEK